MAFGLGLCPLAQTPPNELRFPVRVSDLVKFLPAHTDCRIPDTIFKAEKRAWKTGLEALSISVMCGAHGTRQLVRERA